MMASWWPYGLHHNGMHDFILDEALLGTRVAHAQDAEDTGFGALFDLDYAAHVAAEQARLTQEAQAENDLTLDRRQLPA